VRGVESGRWVRTKSGEKVRSEKEVDYKNILSGPGGKGRAEAHFHRTGSIKTPQERGKRWGKKNEAEAGRRRLQQENGLCGDRRWIEKAKGIARWGGRTKQLEMEGAHVRRLPGDRAAYTTRSLRGTASALEGRKS